MAQAAFSVFFFTHPQQCFVLSCVKSRFDGMTWPELTCSCVIGILACMLIAVAAAYNDEMRVAVWACIT